MAAVLNTVTSLLPFHRGHVVSTQDSMAAIQQVSAEFEKVYTNINKLNTSVGESAEQISIYSVSVKKKFMELKKVLIQVPFICCICFSGMY